MDFCVGYIINDMMPAQHSLLAENVENKDQAIDAIIHRHHLEYDRGALFNVKECTHDCVGCQHGRYQHTSCMRLYPEHMRRKSGFQCVPAFPELD